MAHRTNGRKKRVEQLGILKEGTFYVVKDRIDRDDEDGVRTYLTGIGQYNLLNKEGEVKLAKLHGYGDRKSTRLNSSHSQQSRMPSSA